MSDLKIKIQSYINASTFSILNFLKNSQRFTNKHLNGASSVLISLFSKTAFSLRQISFKLTFHDFIGNAKFKENGINKIGKTDWGHCPGVNKEMKPEKLQHIIMLACVFL